MAEEGQLFEAPDGNTLRLVRITEDLLEMEATYSGAGALPPPHFHPAQDECFEVLEGAVQVVVDGDGPARVKWEVRPALKTAESFEGVHRGEPMRDPQAFLARYADEFRLAQ